MIGPHTQGWSTTLATPVVGDAANLAHEDMQDKARDIGERFDVEHDLNVSTTDDGRHAAGSARSGVGATAARPPDRTTTAQEGPSASATGGNESGRLFYDTTRAVLQVSDGTNWQDVGIPAGIIVMWSGTIGNIPSGFSLCDGSGSTPDLSGKFIVGYDAGDADYSTIGNTGGSKTHTLTTDELPSHSHVVPAAAQLLGGGANTINTLESAGVGTEFNDNTESTGGGSAHENRPPYYTLAYLIKD